MAQQRRCVLQQDSEHVRPSGHCMCEIGKTGLHSMSQISVPATCRSAQTAVCS